MGGRPEMRVAGRLRAVFLGVLAGAIWLHGKPALGQTALSVNGNLVIQGGGANTSQIRYTHVTVGTGGNGAEPQTISLSTSYSTLVIRGPLGFAGACSEPKDCWDGDVCAGASSGVAGACGFSGIPVAAGCSKPSTLDVALDECAWLIAKNRNTGSLPTDVSFLTDYCLSAGSMIASVGSGCPQQLYRDAYDLVSSDVLDGSQRQIQVTGTGAEATLVVPDLQSHLKRIGHWYDNYRQIYPASDGAAANEKVWAQTSKILGNFWKNVYAKVGVPQPGSGTPSDALLDNLFQQGIEADRRVLLAALSSPVPIKTAPLVALMGDALQSMSSRLTQVGMYHDLACRFKSCAHGTVKTEVSELTHFLAAVATPVELATAVAADAPDAVTAHWKPWHQVFASLSAQAGTFQSAVLDALPGITTYSPDLIAPPPPAADAAPPAATVATPPLMGLEKIVQEARARTNSFQATGLFDSRYEGVLRAGMEQRRVSNKISGARDRTTDLENQASTLKATRQQLATTILEQMRNLGNQQKVNDEIRQLFERAKQMRQDIAGLRNGVEVQEARYGEFMQTYNLLAQIAESSGTSIKHLDAEMTVKPRDAIWAGGSAGAQDTDLLSSFVARPALRPAELSWPIDAQKGDVLNLDTSGSWSPACALRTAEFTNPLTGKRDKYVVPKPAPTGPEGYLVNVNKNEFVATTNQSVHTVDSYLDRLYASDKHCAGFGGSVGINFIFSIPLFHASTQFCEGTDDGKRISDATSESASSGGETSMAASFTTGIRLPNTPFPTFPAGSLLVAQVARGGTLRSDIRDVQVVQKPFTSVVISDDADVYFVVNDVVDQEACGAPDGNALTVSLNRIRPIGTLSEPLGAGMATALGHLRDQQAVLLEQGSVGPQQMQALHDLAYTDLSNACGTNCSYLSYYPADLLKFFGTWVSKELATIERKVEARALERQVVLIDMQVAALANDIQNLSDQARLLRLIPTWLLKDLDTELLQNNMRSLLELLVADLYPIVDLRAPSTLQRLDQNLLSALLYPTRSSGDWAGSLVDWTSAAVEVSKNIVDRLEEALGDSLINDRIVLVGIPNPSVATHDGNWQRVAPERAQVIWDDIANKKKKFITVGIEPSDLYPLESGATHHLVCSEAVPVITAMAIYMVRPGLTETFAGQRAEISVDPQQRFPDVGELKSYRIDNDNWVNQSVAVLAGEWGSSSLEGPGGPEAAVAKLTADTATPLDRTMNGLSPFTHFDISLDGIATVKSGPAPADSASEMVIAFRLQTRNSSKLKLDPMCPKGSGL